MVPADLLQKSLIINRTFDYYILLTMRHDIP